ncbi:MAG: MoaD/ThiS family protein [Chloroflexi bacterium]|nr:MoaD/ThiS family protein [Chloroflexota bacterium]
METARVIYRKQVTEVAVGMTVRSAILKLGLDPSSVIPLLAKRVVNEQTILEAGDELKLVNVISGG